MPRPYVSFSSCTDPSVPIITSPFHSAIAISSIRRMSSAPYIICIHTSVVVSVLGEGGVKGVCCLAFGRKYLPLNHPVMGTASHGKAIVWEHQM